MKCRYCKNDQFWLEYDRDGLFLMCTDDACGGVIYEKDFADVKIEGEKLVKIEEMKLNTERRITRTDYQGNFTIECIDKNFDFRDIQILKENGFDATEVYCHVDTVFVKVKEARG